MDKNEIMDVFNRMNEFQKKRTLCYYPLRRAECKEDKENLVNFDKKQSLFFNYFSYKYIRLLKKERRLYGYRTFT